MGVITKITVQQKRIDRYNIEVDGNYAFSVDEAVLIEFDLKKGRKLTAEEKEEIQSRDQTQKGFNMAVNFLSLRMRSEKETADYLKKKEIDPEAIEELIGRLIDLGFLNDEQFADAFVKTQIQTTEKGPAVILRELKEKGISDEVSVRHVSEFTREQQVEKAARLFEKQLTKYKRDSAFLRQRKAEQYVMTKGYSADVVKQAVSVQEPDEDREFEALMSQAQSAHRRYQNNEKRVYRQKMKAALYRKGFDLSAIDKAIEQIEAQEAEE